MQNQYSIAAHTILPLVYRILGPYNHISYLLKDPVTKSLFMFNPLTNIFKNNPGNNKTNNEETETKYHEWMIEHIRNLEISAQSKLTHIVCNYGMQKEYEKFMDKLKKINEGGNQQIKLLAPDSNKRNQLKPEVIGEISICFIGAQGYTNDYNLIGVTHISPTSTKIPVLFVNNLLGVCRVDYQYDLGYTQQDRTDEGYLKSLDKIKYFPNDTYIFPSTLVQQEDLLFAKAVLSAEASTASSAALIDEKIKLYQKSYRNNPDCLIPTTVMEQKLMNPFLNSERFSQLLGVKSKDRAKCFGLLRNMRNEWKDNVSLD